MHKPPQPKSPDTFIRFGKLEYGWVQVALRRGDDVFEGAISYLTDGLARFLPVVELVANGTLAGAECWWANEPGVFAVVLRWQRYPFVELSVGLDHDEPRWRAVVEIHELVSDVVRAYRDLHARYGDDEYLRHWTYPFPHAGVSVLETWLELRSDREEERRFRDRVVLGLSKREWTASTGLASALGQPHTRVVGAILDLERLRKARVNRNLSEVEDDAVEAILLPFDWPRLASTDSG